MCGRIAPNSAGAGNAHTDLVLAEAGNARTDRVLAEAGNARTDILLVGAGNARTDIVLAGAGSARTDILLVGAGSARTDILLDELEVDRLLNLSPSVDVVVHRLGLHRQSVGQTVRQRHGRAEPLQSHRRLQSEPHLFTRHRRQQQYAKIHSVSIRNASGR